MEGFEALRVEEDGSVRTLAHKLEDTSPEGAVMLFLAAWRERRFGDANAVLAKGEGDRFAGDLQLLRGRVLACQLLREGRLALVSLEYSMAGRGALRDHKAAVEVVRERAGWRVRASTVMPLMED